MHLSDFERSDDEGDGSLDFGIGKEEMKEEMMGMKRAIYGQGFGMEDEDADPEQDEEVEKLQEMMLKMQAARGKFIHPDNDDSNSELTVRIDMGADLPEPERKRLAAKAVSQIMKTL